MTANPFLGIVFHFIGGFGAGTFYLPFKGVRRWAWESYWLVGGLFTWVVAPLIVTYLTVPQLIDILRQAPTGSLVWTYLFGMGWGIGGLTFGLSLRYLGMSLGMAVALGFCAFFGTLIPPLLGMVVGQGWADSIKEFLPPIYDQNFLDLLKSTSGLVTLGGLVVCLVGITLCGQAGMSKERELPEDAKKATIAEFSFVKGMWVAVFSGIMSACMAFAIKSGDPMGTIAAEHGVSNVFKNTPVLIVVLAGGFTTNFIWCMILCAMNGSFGHFFSGRGASMVGNYFFSAVAGTTWYLQFFFYSMGTTQMGKYDFASWTLHMATIIIFSNMWGLILHEWKGTSRRTHNLILLGIIVLIASTVIVGGGTWLKTAEIAGSATAPAMTH